MSGTATKSKIEPTLKLHFISHGTLGSKDIQVSRRFYEEFLGLEVVQTSHRSLMLRLGGVHTYAVVQVPGKGSPMSSFLNHNGLDVRTDSDVDECYRLVIRDAEKWGLHDISKPKIQHGTYSFYFWDADGNSWEILTNPPGGYTWLFEQGDQEGKGHSQKSFPRPQQVSID